MIKTLVVAIDAGLCEDVSAFSKKFDLLDAMNTIVASWSEITAKTIANCFLHAGFLSRDGGGDEIPLAQLLAALHGMDQQSFDDMLSVENGLETAPPQLMRI